MASKKAPPPPKSRKPKKPRETVITWKAVLAKFGMKVREIDLEALKTKILEDFQKYAVANAKKPRAATASTLTPEQLADGTKKLHTTFKTYVPSNEVDLGSLAAFYTVANGGELGKTRDLIRDLVTDPSNLGFFVKSKGPAPKISRHKLGSGKETELGRKAAAKTESPEEES